MRSLTCPWSLEHTIANLRAPGQSRRLGLLGQRVGIGAAITGLR
jgi:hypothetical protein